MIIMSTLVKWETRCMNQDHHSESIVLAVKHKDGMWLFGSAWVQKVSGRQDL